MIEQNLLAYLGSLVSNRVYPRVPQAATFPLIRYQRISSTRNANIEGGDSGPSEITIQIDCMARGSGAYGQSKLLSEQVRKSLNFHRGALGDISVQFVTMESESDFDQQDGDDITHWVSQRYTFYVNEGI